MDYFEKIIGEIELHSPEGLRDCFAHGVNPNEQFKGRALIYELISEYARTPRFSICVKTFVEAGLHFEDKALLAVLLDDTIMLERELSQNLQVISKRYNLPCAYTPLYEVTLLHICAEFNHTSCAKTLLTFGADVNAKAGIDQHGFGGQTPIFHTVNQNGNHAKEILVHLIANSADLKLTIAGLIWGKGYDWETLIPAVNPISYAMMGLLPQMHRNPVATSDTVVLLLKEAYHIDYLPQNVPCKYLK